MLQLAQLEARDTPRVWIAWESSDHPAIQFNLPYIQNAANLVAIQTTKPGVEVIRIRVEPLYNPNAIADGGMLPEGVGLLRIDVTSPWPMLYQFNQVIGHEFIHILGVTWHNPLPQDVMYPYARPIYGSPWVGQLSYNDVLALNTVGVYVG